MGLYAQSGLSHIHLVRPLRRRQESIKHHRASQVWHHHSVVDQIRVWMLCTSTHPHSSPCNLHSGGKVFATSCCVHRGRSSQTGATVTTARQRNSSHTEKGRPTFRTLTHAPIARSLSAAISRFDLGIVCIDVKANQSFNSPGLQILLKMS